MTIAACLVTALVGRHKLCVPVAITRDFVVFLSHVGEPYHRFLPELTFVCFVVGDSYMGLIWNCHVYQGGRLGLVWSLVHVRIIY